MSDLQNPPVTPLTGLRLNDRQVTDSIIDRRFFSDYAIVQSVNSDKTIDVMHVIKTVMQNGSTLPPTVTKSVEVMFTASLAFGIDFPIQVGDLVLLIGLKNIVSTVEGITQPQMPGSLLHYTQSNLKAIPLGIVSSPMITLSVDDSGNIVLTNSNASGHVKLQAQSGLFQIKNETQSLYTQLNTIISDLTTLVTGLQTFTTGLNVATLSAQAAAMAATAASSLVSLATASTNLALLLEA